MDISAIQASLDNLVKQMGDKGLRMPAAELSIRSGEPQVVVITKHAKERSNWAEEWAWHKGDTTDAALSVAATWVASLPTPEEHHRAVFLSKAGDTADYAAKHLPGDPIASEVRATIVAGMQRLSDNALTSERAV